MEHRKKWGRVFTKEECEGMKQWVSDYKKEKKEFQGDGEGKRNWA